jgi:hypothetical protein
VQVNGKPAAAAMDSANGRLLVQVPAGQSVVSVDWHATADQVLGWILTASSFCAAGLMFLRRNIEVNPVSLAPIGLTGEKSYPSLISDAESGG